VVGLKSPQVTRGVLWVRVVRGQEELGEQGQEEEQRVRMSGSKIYRKPIAGCGCVETKREEGGNSTLY